MADLVIRIQEYIGESYFDWDTYEMHMATNAADVRMAVEYAQYDGPVTGITLEMGICYGGSVWTAIEIYNYLRGLNIPITTRVLALCASAGTILLLAGDTIELHQTAQLMVHAPSGGVDGTPAEMRAYLQGLENCQQVISDLYVARTGQTAELVATWFLQDTWLTAAQASALGFCTTVLPLAPATAAADAAPTAALKTRFATMVAKVNKATPAPAPGAAIIPPVPTAMAKPAVKPTPRAAANSTAAKAPVAKKSLWEQFKAFMNEADGEESPDAAIETTELANGAMLYHDGALAVDAKVFEDEALTVVPADGDYDTADSRVLTVAGGIVTGIADTENAENNAGDEGDEPTVESRLAALEEKLATANTTITNQAAELTKFKNLVPPTPKASPRQAAAPQVDAKATPRANGKGRGLLAGASATV